MDLPKPTKSPRSKKQHVSHLKAKHGLKLLGSGAFARVYQKKNSNRVIKIGDTYDSYLKYVKRIGLKATNPYFPKLYKIEINRHSSFFYPYYQDYYVIEMEKLIPFRSVPLYVQRKALNKLGARDLFELGYRIKKNIGKKERQCLQLLKKLWKSTSMDIHYGNIMFRKRGHGYQLVFTDPAA